MILKLVDGGEAIAVQTDTPNGLTVSVYGALGVTDVIGPAHGRGWSSPGGTLLSVATPDADGLMSAADRTTLNALAVLLGPIPTVRPFSGGSLLAAPPAIGFTPWITPTAGLAFGYAVLPAEEDSDTYYWVQSDPGWDGGPIDVEVGYSANDTIGSADQVAKLNVAIRSVSVGDDIDVAFAGPGVDADLTFVADKISHTVTFDGVQPEGATPAGGDFWLIRIGRRAAGDTLLGALLPLGGQLRYLATLGA
jgi:hypothetical protein